MLSWNDDQKGEGLKIILIKNIFGLENQNNYENFFQELEEDLLLECEMRCGPVQRIKIFEVINYIF